MKSRKPWIWEAPKDDWEKTPLPMRPSGDDLDFREEAIARWSTAHGVPRVLILGVTPQYFHLPWPTGTSILAVDRSIGMIESVWPGPRGNAILADWISIPLSGACRDLALCDGGLSIVPFPGGLAGVATELRRIVAPGGLAIFRLYVPPARTITVEEVFADVRDRKVATSMEFSILLWGALYDPADSSYKAGESLTAMEAHGISPRELFAEAGWNPDEVDNLEKMREGDIWLYFPTVRQVEAAFADGFALEDVLVPTYRLGERFPTVIFRRLS